MTEAFLDRKAIFMIAPRYATALRAASRSGRDEADIISFMQELVHSTPYVPCAPLVSWTQSRYQIVSLLTAFSLSQVGQGLLSPSLKPSSSSLIHHSITLHKAP